jgi:hypothetical protein
MNDNRKPIRRRDPVAFMEALLDDAAEQAAEDHVPSADDIEWSRGIDAMVERRLAALRPSLPRAHPELPRGVTIPSHVQALGRAELLLTLEVLRQGSLIQYAHQDLTGLSDHDLRTILALMLESSERR